MKHLSAIFILAMLCVCLTGCIEPTGKTTTSAAPAAAAVTPPAPAKTTGSADFISTATVRGSEKEGEGDSAVHGALMWSEKYAQAVEQVSKLQKENRELADRSQKLSEQNTKTAAELAQCRKELDEANAMMLEMKGELEKWKASVLGFREEMRQAQQAQLEALCKVIKLVGGEVPASQPATAANTLPADAKDSSK